MQILLNCLNELSMLFLSLPVLTGEELWSPLPLEAAVVLGDLDDAEALVLPNARVDCTVFFLGEGVVLDDKSKNIVKNAIKNKIIYCLLSTFLLNGILMGKVGDIFYRCLNFILLAWHRFKLIKVPQTTYTTACICQGFQLEPVAGEIRRLFHVNSPPTFLWKLTQFKQSIDVLSLNNKAKI